MPAPLTPPATIAFIGLGMMGKPMAAHLIAAGYRLRVYDASQQAVSDFVGAHPTATATPSAKAAADGADAVITMLPDGKIVRQAVLDGSDAAAEGLPRGHIVIDMSSSAPLGTRALSADLAARGLRYIDAPVSGGVRRALDGSLAIMAGGTAEDVAQCRPLLQAMGKTVFHTGAIGSGHALKALNNYLSATSLLSMCEALIVGEKFGLDPTVMVEVFNTSSGMSNSTQVKAKPFVIPRNYTAGFALALMAKDLATAAELADQMGVRVDTMQDMAKVWADAMRKLGKDTDHTAIHRYLEER